MSLEQDQQPEKQDRQEARFSELGCRFSGRTGILELMEDLGHAMTTRPEILMLGGGNPAHVPELQDLWRRLMAQLLAETKTFDRLLANYDPPGGNPRFLRAMATLLQRTYGWPVEPDNIAVTNGAQTALFCLFNLLGGPGRDGRQRKILLPLSPEYIGYADQGLEPGMLVSCRPLISWPEGEGTRLFKYRIDFPAVEQTLRQETVAAMVVSRPTNPTGNLLTDEEITRLSSLAASRGIPLIIDSAYGDPFPGVVFKEMRPHWAPHVVLTLSLSKLGLPGTRTGVVVGPHDLIAAIESMTAVAGLANSNLGQQLVLPLIETGAILDLGPRILRPFYEARNRTAQGWLQEMLGPTGVNWAMHVSEGAFFHWLWFRGLRVSTTQLYERLKERDVLVVPGDYFFFGLPEDWSHRHECLRVSFAQNPETVREGLRRIAEELARAS